MLAFGGVSFASALRRSILEWFSGCGLDAGGSGETGVAS
jgi:hypothetical protein